MQYIALQVQGRQRPQKTLRGHWVCNATYLIVVTKWITRPWAKYTKGLRKLALGAALTNLIASPLQSSPYAQHNTRQFLLPIGWWIGGFVDGFKDVQITLTLLSCSTIMIKILFVDMWTCYMVPTQIITYITPKAFTFFGFWNKRNRLEFEPTLTCNNVMKLWTSIALCRIDRPRCAPGEKGAFCVWGLRDSAETHRNGFHHNESRLPRPCRAARVTQGMNLTIS